MKIKYYDLYYFVLKNRDEKKVEKDEYENIDKDYIIYDYFIIPNYNIGIKAQETILR